MTAFSFILEVISLVVATGAGAASRQSLGTAVFGGLLAATIAGVVFIPYPLHDGANHGRARWKAGGEGRRQDHPGNDDRILSRSSTARPGSHKPSRI